MVLVEVFCFWFSVRLGSIIIGVFTSVQCCALLVLGALCINNPEEFTDQLHSFVDKFLTKDGHAKKVIPDLKIYLIPLEAYITFLLLTSILLIIGSFKMKITLLYPFVITYPVYVLLILGTHVGIMLFLKNHEFGIGDLILYSNLGAFTILFFLYLWLVVFCFLQILKELNSQVEEKQKWSKVNVNTVSIIPSTFEHYSYTKYVP